MNKFQEILIMLYKVNINIEVTKTIVNFQFQLFYNNKNIKHLSN